MSNWLMPPLLRRNLDFYGQFRSSVIPGHFWLVRGDDTKRGALFFALCNTVCRLFDTSKSFSDLENYVWTSASAPFNYFALRKKFFHSSKFCDFAKKVCFVFWSRLKTHWHPVLNLATAIRADVIHSCRGFHAGGIFSMVELEFVTVYNAPSGR